MSDYATNLPMASTPLVDSQGRPTQAWFSWFAVIQQRTGGPSGGVVATVINNTTTVTLSGPNGVPTFRDDAQAAAGGVGVGQFYHNGSVFQLRIS